MVAAIINNVMTHYFPRNRFNKFKNKRRKTVSDELKYFHDRKALKPVGG